MQMKSRKRFKNAASRAAMGGLVEYKNPVRCFHLLVKHAVVCYHELVAERRYDRFEDNT